MDDVQSLAPAFERLLIDDARRLPRPRPSNRAVSMLNAIENLLSANFSASMNTSKRHKRKLRKERKLRKRYTVNQIRLKQDLEAEIAALERFLRSGPPVSNTPWPVAPLPATTPPADGWGWGPPRTAPPVAPTTPASAEEQARIMAMRVQQNGIRACKDFFEKSDCDGDGDGDGSDDDEMEDGEEKIGPFKFFMELFDKDGELRGFYEKKWEKGEFCCLVCGGVGEKVGKKFVNCVALVQHANTVSNTKQIRAHRDFGQVVCRLLGWDIDRLPGTFVDDGEHELMNALCLDQKTQDNMKGESDPVRVELIHGVSHGTESVVSVDLIDRINKFKL